MTYRFLRVAAAVVIVAGCSDDPTSPAAQAEPSVATSLTLATSSVGLSSLGETAQITATVADQNGVAMSGASVSWTSSAPDVASVSSSGLVTAVANGSATITSGSGSLSAEASVVVAQVADSIALTPGSLVLGGPGAADTVGASVLDAGGSPIEGAGLAWSSDDEAIATVDSLGVVTAIAAGVANLTVEGTVDAQSLSQALPVLVNPTLQITTASVANGDKNLPYAGGPLTAAGGGTMYSWSVVGGSLPTGLSLEAGGDFVGIPTDPGTSVFTAEVSSEDGQTAQKVLSLVVDDSPYLLPADLCSAAPANAIARFADADLESQVRSALGLGGSDDLSCTLLATLTTLIAGNASISDLTGLQNLTALEWLDLEVNNITDVGPISGLVALERLDLAGNSISDVAPVRDLTQLTYLDLGENTAITDLGPVSGLTALIELGCYRCSVDDIAVVSGLTALTVLDLWANPVADISPVSGLTELVFLRLGNGGVAIPDITPVSGLTKLRTLTLFTVSVDDITALTPLTSLRELDLIGNAITDVSALEGMVNLTELFLTRNGGLSNIQPLVDNVGLGTGDRILIEDVSPAMLCSAVAALEAKGVNVVYTSCS